MGSSCLLEPSFLFYSSVVLTSFRLHERVLHRRRDEPRREGSTTSYSHRHHAIVASFRSSTRDDVIGDSTVDCTVYCTLVTSYDWYVCSGYISRHTKPISRTFSYYRMRTRTRDPQGRTCKYPGTVFVPRSRHSQIPVDGPPYGSGDALLSTREMCIFLAKGRPFRDRLVRRTVHVSSLPFLI
jgi:hypothetical protein